MTAATPSLRVVTPWHNAHELAPAYWAAMDCLGPYDVVVVVDNASEPRFEWNEGDPANRFFIRSDVNLGFSRACNLVAEKFGTEDAIVYLNNDIRATSPDWPEQIREALEPGVLVGAHLRDEPHAYVDGVAMPYLDGWCLAGMRADFEALGGWDESYDEPSYYGDNDLCARAIAAGMDLREIPVGLAHLGNYTSRRFAGRDHVTAANRARYENVVRSLRKAS